jgi:hypothetical protein
MKTSAEARMQRQPRPAKWSDSDVGVLLDGLKYERENDPKYPIATRALGLAMAVRKASRHDAMGPKEYMTEELARNALVVIGAHAGVFDAAMKYVNRVDAINPASLNAEDMARRVRSAAPRLANVTNATVISFSLLEGAWTALNEADLSLGNDFREIADHYYVECGSMTVVRLVLLLDADDGTDSFQTVYRCLSRPEVVDALVRQVGEDHWEPSIAEERLRRSVTEFLRLYGTIGWELHGRLVHFRNLGIAHLGGQLRKRVTHAELRELVHLVRGLAACLEPLTESVVPAARDDEILNRTEKATRMWRAALSRKTTSGGRERSS